MELWVEYYENAWVLWCRTWNMCNGTMISYIKTTAIHCENIILDISKEMKELIGCLNSHWRWLKVNIEFGIYQNKENILCSSIKINTFGELGEHIEAETRIRLNTLRPRQDGRHFPDDIFKCICLNENVWISLTISLKCVRKVRINNIPLLVQIMAWRRPGDKPLSEPMMVSLLTHIFVTRPQWVKNCDWDTGNEINNEKPYLQANEGVLDLQ